MTLNNSTLRVLVVDDNRDAADSLSRLIQLWGHVVRTAYDEAAIELVTTFQPDIVLLDLGMPRMDGASMARHMRQKTARDGSAHDGSARDGSAHDGSAHDGSAHDGLVIVAVTGFHDDQTRQRCQQAGIDQFMIKPVDLPALEKLLKATGSEKQRLASLPNAEGKL